MGQLTDRVEKTEAATMNESDISTVRPCLRLPSVNFSPLCFHAWFMWCGWCSSIFSPCFTRQETEGGSHCKPSLFAVFLWLKQTLMCKYPIMYLGAALTTSSGSNRPGQNYFPVVWLSRTDWCESYLRIILAKWIFHLQYTYTFFFFFFTVSLVEQVKEGGRGSAAETCGMSDALHISALIICTV